MKFSPVCQDGCMIVKAIICVDSSQTSKISNDLRQTSSTYDLYNLLTMKPPLSDNTAPRAISGIPTPKLAMTFAKLVLLTIFTIYSEGNFRFPIILLPELSLESQTNYTYDFYNLLPRKLPFPDNTAPKAISGIPTPKLNLICLVRKKTWIWGWIEGEMSLPLWDSQKGWHLSQPLRQICFHLAAQIQQSQWQDASSLNL